jgi:hypothetical protein
MSATDIMGNLFAALAGGLVSWFINRKKTEAESENLATDILERTLKVVQKESEDLRNQIQANKNYIYKLEKQQDDCDERARVQNIELGILRRWIVNKKIETDEIRIFVMDDDEFVRHSFKERFERISITKVHLLVSIEELRDWIDLKPEILILDYYVNGQTIDKFMEHLFSLTEYRPKVIVISGMYRVQIDSLPFRDKVTFISKDEDFVNIAVNAVMNFIEKGLK